MKKNRSLNSWQKRRRGSGWSGGFVEWVTDDTAYLSIVFSWLLPKAVDRARYWKFLGHRVRVGGPAVDLNPGYFGEFAEEGGCVSALQRHNSLATRTTTGCIRKCPFCAVPEIEGRIEILREWPVLPIICDNNLLATDEKHFNHVIDRYIEKQVGKIDFNQGLDARELTNHHASRFVELHRHKLLKMVRLAWDWDTQVSEDAFRKAYQKLRDAGIPKRKISVYVLLGFYDEERQVGDTPEGALYRLQSVKDMGSFPFPMRYQPLRALKKNDFVSPLWTEYQLRRYVKYWSDMRHLSGIPFDEFHL